MLFASFSHVAVLLCTPSGNRPRGLSFCLEKENVKKIEKNVKKVLTNGKRRAIMKSQRGQKPERKTEDKKMEKIVKWLEGCGFNKSEATKEAEAMIKYHTTGYDAVSREYAIELILADID